VNRPTSAKRFSLLAVLVISALSFAPPATAQKDKKTPQVSAPIVKRTTLRHEVRRLAYGGTLTLSGAPAGSITIEGWQRSEVDVTAEIELQAGSAQDLDQLLAINNFAVDEDANHVRILTTGTAGNGPIKLSGVEGAIRLNALQSVADLTLTGGSVSVLVQSGAINLAIPARGWHGLGAEIKMASGNLKVELLPGFNADIDAEVMRSGEIKSSYPNLQPLERTTITTRSMQVRAGSGGATLTFTVGDGTIEIRSAGSKQ
jgi:type 1 fimbria pilin